VLLVRRLEAMIARQRQPGHKLWPLGARNGPEPGRADVQDGYLE
jgi:hypothetical protein